ncbi:MAG: hypothetical protein ABMA64_12490 [Myxococcota bacterium]
MIGWWVACAQPVVPALDAPSAEERWRALVVRDRAALVAEVDAVIALARSDPDPRVRAAALRHLAYTEDPRFLEVAEGVRGTDAEADAIVAAAFHPGGCELLVRWWATTPAEYGVPVDLRLYDAFVEAGRHAVDCPLERSYRSRPSR